MKRLLYTIGRLWRFANCDHWNQCKSIKFEDSTELKFCTYCGRLIYITDEGHRTHNPHLLKDRL